MPFKATLRHQYWTVDIRYLDYSLDEDKVYWITVIENFSRSILARTVSRKQELSATCIPSRGFAGQLHRFLTQFAADDTVGSHHDLPLTYLVHIAIMRASMSCTTEPGPTSVTCIERLRPAPQTADAVDRP